MSVILERIRSDLFYSDEVVLNDIPEDKKVERIIIYQQNQRKQNVAETLTTANPITVA